MIRVTQTPVDEFTLVNQQSNIVLAIFTTSLGRLFVYKHMEIVQNLFLYVDTDSIFYIKRNARTYIELGIRLGVFKDEPKGDDIEEGMISYGYKTRNNQAECHIKWFTLDYNTCKNINLKSMAKLVKQSHSDTLSVACDRMRRESYGQIVTPSRLDTEKIQISSNKHQQKNTCSNVCSRIIYFGIYT